MNVLFSAVVSASLVAAFVWPRNTYLIGASGFSVRKEVRRDGDERFFERNVYSWGR